MTGIAKYNGMMSYLTRPPAPPKTQVADLVDDLEPGALKDELKEKFDPSQETYEEYLQRKGLGERPFNASEGGSPLVPKPKPYTLDQFKQKADLYIKGALGGFDRGEMVDLLQKQLDKVEESESINKQEALQFIQERTQQLREFIKENPGKTLPGLDRVNKAIGGGAFVGEELPNNREGFKLIADRDSIKGPLTRGAKKDQYSIRVRDDKTNERYQKYFKDEEKLNKFVETNSPKEFISADDLRVIANNLKKTLGTLPTQTQVANEAGITITAVKNRLTEGTDYAKPLTPQEAAKIGGKVAAEKKTKGLIKPGDEEGLAKLQKKVDALNKKYNLSDKGVSFNVTKTSSGNFGTTIQYKAGIYRDTLGKTRDTGSLKELEKIMQKFSKTKLFKNYSKAEMFTAGGIKSAIKQLRNAGSKQDLMFEYILNSEQTPTIEELSKKFKMSEDLVTKDIKRLYTNIYRRAAGEGAPYLPGNQKTLSNVLEKVTNMDVDLTKDSVLNLITDAYGDSEQGDALRSKVRKFYKLQTKIPEEYQKFFSSQLDHIIPLNFLTQIRSDIPAEDLIRINPLPGFLNQRAFKSQLDTAIGTAKRIGDTEAIKAYSELQTFLPEVLGGISKTGKITDFGAETLTEDRSLTKAQQTQTKKIYDSVLKFINNPKAGPLLEKLGINQETAFDALRGSGQLIRKNIPGFLNTFRRILKENPDLRVELGDEFADIENQYASLNMEGDFRDFVAREEEKKKDPLPYEAALPAGVAAGKYGPQVLKLLKNVGKASVRPVISPIGGVSFSLAEMLSDDPSQALAGLELLYPEVIRQVKGKVSPVKNIYDKALALSPNLRYAPYVTKGMSGIGSTMIGADILQGLAKRIGPDQRGPLTEQELLDMRERETYMGNIADAFDKAYREGTPLPGRTNFADGPEDPSKRKFMKILGGLASLPIVGRFFDIGEKAAPVVQNIFTEVKKLKDTKTLMPDWFPAFVDKFRKEGKAENMFKKKKIAVTEQEYNQALAEGKGQDYFIDPRTPEYIAKNPDHSLYNKLVETDELIGTTYTNEKFPGVNIDDFDGEVQVNWENDYSQPVNIVYVKPGGTGPDVGRPDKFQAGISEQEFKPKGEFSAMDQEVYATDPDGGYDTNAVIVNSLDDMMEGTTRMMEEYATGKPVKKLSRGEGKVIEAEIRAEQAADAAAEAADDLD
jgi:hypothetical protein